ncbi:MAG: hypothetical protein MUE69_08020 [Myxococcota bacterium]|jgi:hypothetical protein|nr:hypothetical protein [Myxococcota bacterium]
MRVGSWRGALVSALVGLTMSACADPDPSGSLDGGLPAERMDADRSDVARIDADMLDAAEDSAHADAARDASMDTSLDEPSDGGTTDDGAAPLSDASVVLGEPGMPCDAARPCAEGSRCVYLAATHTVGYCAPTCTTLHTTCGFFGPGVHAECTFELDDGTLVCGFVCLLDHGDHTHDYTCPSGDWGRLRCERTPREFAHRYCAPSQD